MKKEAVKVIQKESHYKILKYGIFKKS